VIPAIEVSPDYPAEHLNRVNGHIRRRLGIHISPEKHYLLAARITKILSREGYATVEEFLRDLDAGHPGSVEALSRHVTTNHTYFFREPSHFTTLADRLEANRSAHPVIWSAACSTGEEPYTIAMTLIARGFSDFLVVASDINTDALDHASRGVFPESKMLEIPEDFRDRFFLPAFDGHWQVVPVVKRHIRIKKINLAEPVAFEEPVDHIFCRNLLIYFDKPGGGKIVENVSANLKPGGLLFIGKSEVLFDLPPGLKKLESSLYEKVIP
jgi:chemotaxis protein methyltransferase CheR